MQAHVASSLPALDVSAAMHLGRLLLSPSPFGSIWTCHKTCLNHKRH